MTTFTKVQKPSLVMTIPICPCVRQKVGNFSLYVSSTVYRDSCNGILKCIIGCNVLTLTQSDHIDIVKNVPR